MTETRSPSILAPTYQTRVIPLPSSRLPLSECMDQMSRELEEYGVDSLTLREISGRLNILTQQLHQVQSGRNADRVPDLLRQTIATMQEAGLILRMMAVTERGHLPKELIDHLSRIRSYIDQTLSESRSLLDAIGPRNG